MSLRRTLSTTKKKQLVRFGYDSNTGVHVQVDGIIIVITTINPPRHIVRSRESPEAPHRYNMIQWCNYDVRPCFYPRRLAKKKGRASVCWSRPVIIFHERQAPTAKVDNNEFLEYTRNYEHEKMEGKRRITRFNGHGCRRCKTSCTS